MAKKFYGVKAGFRTGIFTSWEECEKQVKGYSNAQFKGFATLEEAKTYIGQKTKASKSMALSPHMTFAPSDSGVLSLYVDGSFDAKTNAYGMGFLIVRNGKIQQLGSGRGTYAEYVESRNVAGEVEATRAGLYEIYQNYKAKYPIVVYHDYEGVGQWANKNWKANKPLTQGYKDFVFALRKAGMKITFTHVKGHSGNEGNELADILARYSLGMVTEKEASLVKTLQKTVKRKQEKNKGS